MARVYFVREKISMEVPLGVTVLEAEIRAGLEPDAPCGGQGSCGKCLVKVNGNPVLACQTKVAGDCQVEIPGRKKRGKILSEGFSRNVNFQPDLRVKRIRLEKPEIGEKRSEWERLLAAVYGDGEIHNDHEEIGCKNSAVPYIKVGAADVQLSGILYEKRMLAPVWEVIYTENEILDFRQSSNTEADLCQNQSGNDAGYSEACCNIFTAAIDLGTTTIVGYLLDGRNGQTLATESRMNPQMQYGGDVIQRADYVLEHSTEALSECVRKTINEILENLIGKAPKVSDERVSEARDIYQISLVGNTCMHHLFLGISPASLVHAPYTPAISQPLTLRASDYGIQIHKKGQLILLPNIAGYIGADTSGCLLALRQDLKEEITLLLDIGTNTEMILGNKYGLAACSAASGPAFEGPKIQCGMRGLPGAIDHVKYENGKWQYTTIENEKPTGLCGSGLIDLVAELLRAGLLDENGIFHSGQEKEDIFVLVPPGEHNKGVYLTQKDIGEVQLAKAAIAAGIRLLMKKRNVEESQIQTVYLAGGFGNYMNASNAAQIGLIPESFAGKVQCVGNAAGEGAKIALLNKNERLEMEAAVQKIEFLELAACPEFQDCFVDELGFGK